MSGEKTEMTAADLFQTGRMHLACAGAARLDVIRSDDPADEQKVAEHLAFAAVEAQLATSRALGALLAHLAQIDAPVSQAVADEAAAWAALLAGDPPPRRG